MSVIYDYSKLRGRMVEKGFTISSLAECIGIQPRTLGTRLNNESEFKHTEIDKIVIALEIPDDEVSLYFFTK